MTANVLALIFGLFTGLLLRANTVRWWEAITIALFGWFLSFTTQADMALAALVQWVVPGFTYSR